MSEQQYKPELVKVLEFMLRIQRGVVAEELVQLQERLAVVRARLGADQGDPELPSSGVLQSAAAFEAAVGKLNGLQAALKEALWCVGPKP